MKTYYEYLAEMGELKPQTCDWNCDNTEELYAVDTFETVCGDCLRQLNVDEYLEE